jgi:dolichyl-phosphate-mannose-protein mannosyltransferase
MSPNFQATLAGSKLSGKAELIVYGASVTMKHYGTSAYLHSHKDRYPLEYADGRISSQGQQVTGYPHKDANNHWRLKPADPQSWESVLWANTTHDVIQHESLVVLEHVSTRTHLLTHDVASPHMPTNQEFTTIQEKDWITRLNETLFRIEIDRAKDKTENLKTLGTQFRLVSVKFGVAMFTHKKPLPDWGFGQQEINGNKKKKEGTNKWIIEEVFYPNKSAPIPRDTSSEGIERPSFLSKFAEMQSLMISHNAGLTKPHPYQSPPQNWPLALRGISFWQNKVDKQIYLIPNAIAWWITLGFLGVYATGWVMERITERRGISVNDAFTKTQLHFSTGFLFVTWLLHYLPFYLMGRSLFLHHYLPAAIIGFMVAGAVYDYVLTTILPDLRKKYWHSVVGWVITAILLSMVAIFYYFYAPVTYGTTGLTKAELNQLKLLDTWDFQYA